VPWPQAGAAEASLDCSAEGRCVYQGRGKKVAIVTAAAGLPKGCNEFDAIVSQVPAGFRCKSQIPVADRIDSWRHGAIGLWLDPDGIAVESANQSRGDRPWVPHPVSARERARNAAAAAPPPAPAAPEEKTEPDAESPAKEPD
jgi:hypothetical protein